MNVKKLFDLTGSVAIVTGGGSGIGHMLATGLAEAGSNLVIASRRYELCKSVCEKFHEKYGIDALPVKVDVTEETDVINMIEKTVDHFKKLDILVNNVGGSKISDTVSTKVSDWDSIMDLNLRSVFLCCREAGKHMITQKYGKIINIASILAERATDWRNYYEDTDKLKTAGQLCYNTTKGGIVSLTKDLAAEWAKYNITVNAISPGAFLTDQTEVFPEYCVKSLCYRIPLGRFGDSDDLKGAVVLLASRSSKYLTGHNLLVDGGWTLWC
jgi:gluconate 5-dehydrogenase